ncbi:MAG TPA: plastocyanin/azurin family copper-binding protein [Trueperaceae bacterium]
MNRFIGLLIGLLLFSGAAFAQQGGEGEVVEIRMVSEGANFYFDPVGIHVAPGTTIRFINESGQHSATAYCDGNGKPQRIPDGAECWNSGILTEAGATFEVTLTEEGVYDYFCIPHEALGMVGRIIVGSADAYTPPEPTDLMPAAQQALPSVDAILGAEGGTLPYQAPQ